MQRVQPKRDSFYLEDEQWLKGRNIVTFIALLGLAACGGLPARHGRGGL